MSLLAIDPSIAASGVALSGPEVGLTVQTVPHKSRKLKGDDRLKALHDGLHAALFAATFHEDPVELAVIEDLPKMAQGAGLTGRAQGVVRYVLITWEVPYVALPPSTVKKAATGKGNANKDAMRLALPDEVTDLGDDNQVDAWWILQCAKHLAGYTNALADPSALKDYELETK